MLTHPPSYPKNESFYHEHIKSKLLKIYKACVRLESYCIHNIGSTNCTYDFCPQLWQNSSYADLRDYDHKSDCYCIHNGCSAGCIIFRLSGVCIFQIQHNCRCVVVGSDYSQNAERIGINPEGLYFTRSFLGVHFYFICPMQDCKFKCIWPMSDASTLHMPYL